MPRRQAQQHVGADEPVHSGPPPPLKLTGGVDGVAGPGPPEFQVVDREKRVAFDREPAHGQPVIRGCQSGIPGLMWWLGARDEQYPTIPPLLRRRPRANEVA